MARCQPSRPVAYLRVHGTADGTIPFAGGRNMPGAEDCVARWRQHNGCADGPEEAFEDLDQAVEGSETLHQPWRDCEGDSGVQLFRIEGGAHVPSFTPASRLHLMMQVMSYVRP